MCGDCKHQDSERCLKCIHHANMGDYYEEISQMERARNEIVSAWVDADITKSFKEAYAQASRVCSYLPNKPIYLTVHASEHSLVASDGYVLIELAANIPDQLKGQNIAPQYKITG